MALVYNTLAATQLRRMKKKPIITKNSKTREDLSNPFGPLSIDERLVLSGAVDLSDNYEIEELGNYIIIKPIDETKKMRNK